jgi:hypothetical protein
MQNYLAEERTNQKQGKATDFHNSHIGCKQNKGPKNVKKYLERSENNKEHCQCNKDISLTKI